MPTNAFEYATRHKLRFESSRGMLTAEQIWDVPLRSPDGFDLDDVAKRASRALKGVSEESFVESRPNPDQERFRVALEAVKCVIDAKLDDERAAARRAKNRMEKEQLMAILAEKQAGQLSELSEKELQRRIRALDE